MLQSERFKVSSEINMTLKILDEQIIEVKRIARDAGVAPEIIQTNTGQFMLSPLLLAKSNLLLAKVNLSKE